MVTRYQLYLSKMTGPIISHSILLSDPIATYLGSINSLSTKAKLLNNTSARYCSIMEDEFFTDEDVADRCRRRGQNPTKKSVAESHYGANMNNANDQRARLCPGTMVRLIDLQNSSHLNDMQGLRQRHSP
eukprot:COSAG02_NODE_520_length_20751_cov_17.817112_20_plen_130_part_00